MITARHPMLPSSDASTSDKTIASEINANSSTGQVILNDAVNDSVRNSENRNRPPSSNEPVHPDIDLQLPEIHRPALQDEAGNSVHADRDPQPPEVDPPASQDETDIASDEWLGMKFVVNIDKTVKSRYMRVDKRNIPIHYVHMYAVRNRINLTHSSEVPPSVSNAQHLDDLLPSQIDDSALSTLFATHISRIHVKNSHYRNAILSRKF